MLEANHSGLPQYSLLEGMQRRRSIRRFLPDPIPDETVTSILRVASRAPSGVNAQPWLIYVVVGGARNRLAMAARAAIEQGKGRLEYDYLPAVMKDPYLSRKRDIGYSLYKSLGVDVGDQIGRSQAMLRNFDFFGAPVGLFFALDKSMAQGSWLDCGMFMQNVMLAALAFGLDTCAQQSWCDVGNVVHQHLDVPDNVLILSGMALGRADLTAPENSLVSNRADPTDFLAWRR